MSKRGWGLAAVALGMLGAGCATQVALPSHVAVTPVDSSNASYVDRVDLSYVAAAPRPFSKVKLCLAENVSNNAVTIRDSAGSWVGPATKTYYQTNNVQSVAGGSTFKYVDEASSTAVVTGTTVSGEGQGLLSKDFVRYDLKAATAGNKVALVFSNISRAQQDTGISKNDGFAPVGAWPGARAPDVVAALEKVGARVRACLN